MAKKVSSVGKTIKKKVAKPKARTELSRSIKKEAVGGKKIRSSKSNPIDLTDVNTLQQELKQRTDELAIINSIQQGLAAELDFQAIVDLVGDKLSEIFNTGDLGIRWYDEKANLLHYLYEHEHGERLFIPPDPPVPGGIFSKILKTRQPIIYKTSADYGERRLLPGTDPSKSLISVPIISSDRVLGLITLVLLLLKIMNVKMLMVNRKFAY